MIIVSESKQVGIIYHFTDDESFWSIINDEGLKSSYFDFISFTRSFSNPKGSHLEYMNVRFSFDGNKLSNKFKIEPYSESGYNEQEERIVWKQNKILKCFFALKRIDILKKSEIKNFSQLEILEFLKVKLPIYFVDKFKPVR